METKNKVSGGDYAIADYIVAPEDNEDRETKYFEGNWYRSS